MENTLVAALGFEPTATGTTTGADLLVDGADGQSPWASSKLDSGIQVRPDVTDGVVVRTDEQTPSAKAVDSTMTPPSKKGKGPKTFSAPTQGDGSSDTSEVPAVGFTPDRATGDDPSTDDSGSSARVDDTGELKGPVETIRIGFEELIDPDEPEIIATPAPTVDGTPSAVPSTTNGPSTSPGSSAEDGAAPGSGVNGEPSYDRPGPAMSAAAAHVLGTAPTGDDTGGPPTQPIDLDPASSALPVDAAQPTISRPPTIGAAPNGAPVVPESPPTVSAGPGGFGGRIESGPIPTGPPVVDHPDAAGIPTAVPFNQPATTNVAPAAEMAPVVDPPPPAAGDAIPATANGVGIAARQGQPSVRQRVELPTNIRLPELLDQGFLKRTRKVRARKVRRVVRHIDPWSVLTFSVLFFLCLFAALLLASVLVWNAAVAAGTIENIEAFIREIGDYQTYEIEGDVVFQAAMVIAGILTLAASVTIVLLVVVFNLISDLVGGIRMTVIEEETVRVRRRRAPPRQDPAGRSPETR